MLGAAYKRYVLGTLTCVYTLNLLDRGLIILLLQPIKEDLDLSDAQLGLLTGIAFGVFYATLGLPIARWADRGNRVTITALAIAVWGATVMACLYVSNFVQLVLARIAAGVGESGCMPPTYSLLGDYFPMSAERTRAMAIYMLGSPLAALISFTSGGWLNELYGWRMTFFIMGVPALILAVVVKLTIREPRVHTDLEKVSADPLPRISHVLSTLWRQRSTRNLCLAIILLWTMGLGLAPWYAAFIMRTHLMGTAELGVWLGLIFGIGGMTGIWIGGFVTSRWFANNERGQMRLSAAMVAGVVPCFVLFLLLANKYHALAALLSFIMIFNFFFAPTFSLMQRLVSSNIRATTLAVVMLLANLIGMGIGPLTVGILSDVLQPVVGTDSLRYAMLAMSFVALWAAWYFWRAGRTVADDLLLVETDLRPAG
jgi:predicted MFS family arabinose efflux permease